VTFGHWRCQPWGTGAHPHRSLGITIDSKLTFNEHVDNICKKANSCNSRPAFISRNTKKCPVQVKATAYKTPQLEYASSSWSPHTKRNIDKIEGVQRHAARATLNDWSRPKSTDTANVITSPSPTQYSRGSSSSMLEFLGWKPLEQRRLHCNLSSMYKIDQDIVAIPATVYLQPVTGYTTRGHNRKFVVPQSRINAYRHSFIPSTVMLWNSLPTSVVMSSSSLATFQFPN